MSKGEAPKRLRLGYGGGSLTGEEATDVRATVGRLFAYARPYTSQLIIVALLVIIGTLAGLASPILFGRAIDDFITPGDVAGLARIALILLGTVLVSGLTAVIYGVIMVRIPFGPCPAAYPFAPWRPPRPGPSAPAARDGSSPARGSWGRSSPPWPVPISPEVP